MIAIEMKGGIDEGIQRLVNLLHANFHFALLSCSEHFIFIDDSDDICEECTNMRSLESKASMLACATSICSFALQTNYLNKLIYNIFTSDLTR